MTQAEKKPFAPACERNQQPILEILQKLLKKNDRVFEIGSGTGQHALYFSNAFPQIQWTTSDHKNNHLGIKQWIAESLNKNIDGPLEYIATENTIPITNHNIVYTSNTIHIMAKHEGVKLFEELSLKPSVKTLIFYGPFNYNGQFTSQSNENFNLWLQERNPNSGIRDFEWVQTELQKYQFELQADHEMPSNNRILHFQR